MNITSIPMLNTEFTTNKVVDGAAEKGDNNKAFQALFDSAMGMISTTDELQKTAEKAAINYAMGFSDNTNELSLIQNKANIAMQYTVLVRNKLLESYKEIMNIQF